MVVSIEVLATFFGWCSVVNISLLLVAAVALILARDPISRIHAKLFGISQKDLSLVYFEYLGHYKVAILVFNLVPYLALRLMA
jgi:Family of unknown function (DUF6868)